VDKYHIWGGYRRQSDDLALGSRSWTRRPPIILLRMILNLKSDELFISEMFYLVHFEHRLLETHDKGTIIINT
jgi:hypothetical protein